MKRLVCVAYWIMRVLSLVIKNRNGRKEKRMKREDIISKARLIARIDSPEEGALDEEAILSLIVEIADENDRLEAEIANVKRQYADAFLSDEGKKEDNEEEEVEDEEIKEEDFLDL